MTGCDERDDAAGRTQTLDLCSEDGASERRAGPLPPSVFLLANHVKNSTPTTTGHSVGK